MPFTAWQSLLNHSYSFIIDAVFLIFEIWTARIVIKTKWKIHLNWIMPFILENAFVLLYRTIWNLHFFTGIHLPPVAYLFAKFCLYAGDIMGVCGAVILCRTFKQIVNATDRNTPESEPDVWPPPPTYKS